MSGLSATLGVNTPSPTKPLGVLLGASNSSPPDGPLVDGSPLKDHLENIQTVELSIKSSLEAKGKKALGLDQLATIVQASIDGIKSLIQNQTHLDKATDKLLDVCLLRLQDVDNHLRAPKAYGKSARAKQKFKGLVFLPYDPYVHFRENLQAAFKAFKHSMEAQAPEEPAQPPPVVSPSNIEPVDHVAPGVVAAPVEKQASPPDSRWATIRDTLQKFLKVTTEIKGFVGEPAGSIIGLVASTGISIIEMLNDMEDNREEAVDLGSRISELVQIVAGFFENRRSKQRGLMYSKTIKQLDSFSTSLKSVQDDLYKLKAQGQLKQGVSHARNKEDLKGWRASIDDARNTLQFQLSLHNVDATEAAGKLFASPFSCAINRIELLGVLGDGDTGASEKVADPDDLVCLPETRGDILGRAESWLKDPSGSRVLWISGVAGCGKSAVAATIADRQTKAGAPVAVFHFARANQARNKRVIRSLARQATCWHSGFLESSILASLQDDPTLVTMPVATQFHRLIVEPVKELPSPQPLTLFVLDALDEWDDHSAATKLIELVKKWDADLPSTIRFVITSRNESHLSDPLTSTSMGSLVTRYQLDAVEPEDVDHDIRIYVETRFERIRSNASQRDHLECDWPGDECIGLLVKEAGGLFQWASTAMSHIQRRGHRQRLDEIIGHSMDFAGLEGLYLGILNLVFEQEPAQVCRLLPDVLGTILVAPVQLDLVTVAYLCRGSTGDPTGLKDDTVRNVLACLGSLLIVPDDPGHPIKIAHPTVFDIFTSATKCSDKRFYIMVNSHHGRVAFSCLVGMTRDLEAIINPLLDPAIITRPPHPLEPDALYEQGSQDIPSSARYSCQYWGHHLRNACRHDDDVADVSTSSSWSGIKSTSQPDRAELRSAEEGEVAKLHQALYDFCIYSLVCWMEASSLLRLSGKAVGVIKDAEFWYSHYDYAPLASDITRSLLIDTRRFSAMFLQPIIVSASNIRSSVLPYAPKDTELFRRYSGSGLKVLQGPVGEQWPATLWTAVTGNWDVRCIAFSPDGKTIASGSRDYNILLWDTGGGAQSRLRLIGHLAEVSRLAYSPDGRTIASCAGDLTVRFWDVGSGNPDGLVGKGHESMVTCLAFVLDGRAVVSGSCDATLRLWNVDSGTQRGSPLIGHTDYVNCLAVGADGRTIVSGSADLTIRIWDASSGTQKGETFTGHTRSVYCLALSPDGKTIASGSSDNTVRFWDVESRTQKGNGSTGHTKRVRVIAFSSDGRTVASGSDDTTVRLWDTDSGTQKGDTLTGHTDGVTGLGFSHDGGTVVTGSRDTTVRFWDAESGAQKGTVLRDHSSAVSCMAFSPDGKTMASGGQDALLCLRDIAAAVAQKQVPVVTHTTFIREVAFSPDGKTLATGAVDGSLCLWDLNTGIQKWDAVVAEDPDWGGLGFTPDGLSLLSGIPQGGTIQKWDLSGSSPSPRPLELYDALYLENKGKTMQGARGNRDLGWSKVDGKWFWMPLGGYDWERYGNIVTGFSGTSFTILDVSDLILTE